MTAPISRGSSGSPVIDMNGKVVGVATFQFASGQNLNFAIPADNILAMQDFKPLEVAAWSEKVSEDKNKTLASLQKDIIKHIKHKKCPAGVCKPLFHYEIDETACTGCRVCARKCPQEAITGEKKEPHELDEGKCIKCGICYDGCKFGAIIIK